MPGCALHPFLTAPVQDLLTPSIPADVSAVFTGSSLGLTCPIPEFWIVHGASCKTEKHRQVTLLTRGLRFFSGLTRSRHGQLAEALSSLEEKQKSLQQEVRDQPGKDLSLSHRSSPKHCFLSL